MALAISNRGIVNHGVEATELVDSFRDRLGPCNGAEVALDYGLGPGQREACVCGARGVAGMQDHLMPLFCKESARHKTETC
jgi:hypothetical protein